MLLFLTGLFQISGNGVTVPVPNDKCGVINYRLITISPVISKLFESVAAILGVRGVKGPLTFLSGGHIIRL